jgi:predicted nucleotide-binding protein
MIDRSWLVIVLAGENNLNVFFEYGYALGRAKPILVVLPESKLTEVPTDIKGFEYIVYKDGDFVGLENEITRHISAVPRFSN